MPAVDEPETRVPLFAEEAHVDKVEVVSDRVRVTTSTDEHEAIAKGVIERGALRVERVAVERQVDAAPSPRVEGDTTIISLVEERLFVEKRLFVVEELRVTLDRTCEQVVIPIMLRATRATVEHPLDPSAEEHTDG